MSVEYPDLEHFQQFIRLCKSEGLMQAECGNMKILLPPPALELTKPGPENLNNGRLRDGGPTPYAKLFPHGIPTFPGAPDAKPVIVDGSLPAPTNTGSAVIDYDALP